MKQLILTDPWTWTEWANHPKWELVIKNILNIKIPEDFVWIKSLDGFKEKYFNFKTWKFINWTYTKVYNFLQRLAEEIDMDPILYLYYLYYVEKWSTMAIYDKLAEFWWYNSKNKDTFTKMFVNTFWWNLRNNSEITEVWIRKIKAANEPKIAKKENIRKEKEEQLYNLFINNSNLSRLSLKVNKITKLESFSKKPELAWRNQLEKIKNFLEIYWYKRKWLSLKDFITFAKDNYWFKVTFDVINDLLKEKGYDLKIKRWWAISSLLKGRYDL